MGSQNNVVSDYEPLELPPEYPSCFEEVDPGSSWQGQYSHLCQFTASVFLDKMMNIIENPNLNTTWLFRADIVQEESYNVVNPDDTAPRLITTRQVRGMVCYRALVRKLIPRNAIRDRPMLQTCAFYTSEESVAGEDRQTGSNLIIFTSHVEDVSEVPFYHPKVKGIAYMHQWISEIGQGIVSVHFEAYDNGPLASDSSLVRIAYRLLKTIVQHANSPNYEKRVHHDLVVPQKRFQDRYSTLKNKYARTVIEHWAENTDPSKHVFEDLGIAAFLIELWADMYAVDDNEAIEPEIGGGHSRFPGFVDIGCGNGLLVYILSQEGFQGWGFDARERKSWSYYKANGHGRCVLEERALLPSLITDADASTKALADRLSPGSTHNGEFPKGTFIIANHADELTAWTPILAAASESPFIMIPCCSHRLSGDKFRAPAPRDKSKSKSVYSSFVDWVTCIAEDCDWMTETEMLRIPSTRNACILGRRRKVRQAGGAEAVLALVLEGEEAGDQERVKDEDRTEETEPGMVVGGSLAASIADLSLDGDEAIGWDVDLDAVIAKYGGAAGYTKSIEKLLVSASGH